MGTYLALILPHKPDAVFQGQLVEISFCWLVFKDDWSWHVILGILKHLCDHLILGVYLFDNAVAELSFDAGTYSIIDFLKHDEFFCAWFNMS